MKNCFVDRNWLPLWDHWRLIQSTAVITANLLATALAEQIKASGLHVDTVCAPALGGLIAGYALAQALDCRYIFAERVNGEMSIRRGFEIKEGEKVLMCEGIITTGGSAMEAVAVVKSLGGEIVGVAALANRGFCKRENSDVTTKPNCILS